MMKFEKIVSNLMHIFVAICVCGAVASFMFGHKDSTKTVPSIPAWTILGIMVAAFIGLCIYCIPQMIKHKRHEREKAQKTVEETNTD